MILTKGPTYRIGLKCGPKKSPGDSPGPGSYRAERSSLAKYAGFLAESKRGLLEQSRSKSPGPGEYEREAFSTFQLNKGVPFGSRPLERQTITPGPSSYNLNYSFVKTASIALKIGKAPKQSFLP